MRGDWIEIFGTAASAVVAVSLTMRNIKRLRILNLVGAAGFTVYGFLIGALPVWILNLFIVAIDAWYLHRMGATRAAFDTLEVDLANSDYARLFLDHYAKDIARFEPSFSRKSAEGCTAEFILRDMVPVSIVVWKRAADGRVEIALDYAAPSWRDYKNAEYWFSSVGRRLSAGRPTVFMAKTAVAEHARYLERMGFAPGAAGADGRREFTMSLEPTGKA
jgi:hypothetical protein